MNFINKILTTCFLKFMEGVFTLFEFARNNRQLFCFS